MSNYVTIDQWEFVNMYQDLQLIELFTCTGCAQPPPPEPK